MSIIVKQKSSNDCGVAVIRCLLKYYNGYVSEEKIRLDTHIDINGINAYYLVDTLKKYGFQSFGVRIPLEKVDTYPLPLILHFKLPDGYFHYVVLLKKGKGYYKIMDPQSGIKKLSNDEINNLYTGISVVAVPQNKIIKLDKSTTLFNLFKTFFIEEKKLIWLLLFNTLILDIIIIITSYFLKMVSLFSTNKDKLIIVIVIFLFLVILKVILIYLNGMYATKLDKDLDYRLNLPFIRHIIHLPNNVLSTRPNGEILKRISELQNIKNIFSELIFNLSLNVIEIISALILLLFMNKTLTIIFIFIIIIFIILNLSYQRKVRLSNYKLIEDETNYQSYLTENIDNYKTIKNIHKYNYFDYNITNKYLNYLDTQYNYLRLLNRKNLYSNFLIEIGLFILMLLGISYILNSSITFIDLFTYISLAYNLVNPIGEMINFIPKLTNVSESFLHISDLLDVEEEILDNNGLPFNEGNINLINVSFNYSINNIIIDNLNQNIRLGDKVFLSGKSGSGKSTLCKLIYGLIPVSKGNIKIGGVSIYDINLDDLRRNITYIAQDDTLFQTSILDNITLGDNYSNEEIDKVLSVCCLNKFIDTLPLHLKTPVLEGSCNLSGGEKQRLILARGLIKDSKILILDEALSQVDIKTEEQIIRNLLQGYSDKTIIYVSHKDVSKYFDKIISI